MKVEVRQTAAAVVAFTAFAAFKEGSDDVLRLGSMIDATWFLTASSTE